MHWLYIGDVFAMCYRLCVGDVLVLFFKHRSFAFWDRLANCFGNMFADVPRALRGFVARTDRHSLCHNIIGSRPKVLFQPIPHAVHIIHNFTSESHDCDSGLRLRRRSL